MERIFDGFVLLNNQGVLKRNVREEGENCIVFKTEEAAAPYRTAGDYLQQAYLVYEELSDSMESRVITPKTS